MDDNKRIALEFVENFRNTICLGWGLELIRLLGFQETKEDYYYVMENTNGKIEWYPVNGWIIGLKGRIEDREYEYIQNRFDMERDTFLPL